MIRWRGITNNQTFNREITQFSHSKFSHLHNLFAWPTHLDHSIILNKLRQNSRHYASNVVPKGLVDNLPTKVLIKATRKTDLLMMTYNIHQWQKYLEWHSIRQRHSVKVTKMWWKKNVISLRSSYVDVCNLDGEQTNRLSLIILSIFNTRLKQRMALRRFPFHTWLE